MVIEKTIFRILDGFREPPACGTEGLDQGMTRKNRAFAKLHQSVSQSIYLSIYQSIYLLSADLWIH